MLLPGSVVTRPTQVASMSSILRMSHRRKSSTEEDGWKDLPTPRRGSENLTASYFLQVNISRYASRKYMEADVNLGTIVQQLWTEMRGSVQLRRAQPCASVGA